MRQIIEIIEVGSSRAAELLPTQPCLLFEIARRRYWRTDGAGGVNLFETEINEPSEAEVMAGRIVRYCSPGVTQIHLFRDVPDGEQAVPPPAEPELPGIARKCKLEQAMSNTVIELLKVAPTNPVARAHALSQLKIPIPDEHQTFEAIKEWVEMNITPKTGRNVPNPAYQQSAGRAARPTEAFRIDADLSENQRGTCRYTCPASGSGSVPITVSELESALEDAESLEDVVEGLRDTIRDTAYEAISMDDSDDYEYSDYEMSDGDGTDVNYNDDRLIERIRDYLLNNDPDRLRELES